MDEIKSKSKCFFIFSAEYFWVYGYTTFDLYNKKETGTQKDNKEEKNQKEKSDKEKEKGDIKNINNNWEEGCQKAQS